MVRVIISFLIAISVFTNSPAHARSITDYAKDAGITVGAVLTFVVLPGIIVSISGAATALTCGKTRFSLSSDQLNDFLDVAQFDAEQAAQAFQVTCAVNQNNESVFVPAMVGSNISRKMLYTRLNKVQKCLQARVDKEASDSSDLVIAEEAKDSRWTQESFTKHAFKGQKTECNSMTASRAQFAIQQKIRTKQIQAREFFPLFFRNNLATDPSVFLPAGSPFLLPTTVEEFLQKEKLQFEAWEEYYRKYPNAKKAQ